MRHVLVIGLLALPALFTVLPAQSITSVEPGVDESRAASTRPAERVTTWTHPTREFRGVWLASNNLLEGKAKLAEQLDLVKSCRFNAVFIDGWFRGYVSFAGSAVAPLYPPFGGEDRFGFAVAEAHRRGLQAHFWLGYGFYAYHTKDATKDPSMGPVLDKRPELVAVHADGTKFLHNATLGDFYSLCPANPESHKLLGELCAEVLAKYDVDGVHLDRIRFPEADYCFCPYCKDHFKLDTGIDLRPFKAGSREAVAFLTWKREQTARAVRYLSGVVRRARPGAVMTSYVLNPDEMDSRAQSWDLWMKDGLLDAVAVSMYGPDVRDYTERAVALLGGDAGKLLNAVSAAHGSDVYPANVEVTRRYKTAGQVTWWLGDLPKAADALRAGPYAEPAEPTIGPKPSN